MARTRFEIEAEINSLWTAIKDEDKDFFDRTNIDKFVVTSNTDSCSHAVQNMLKYTKLKFELEDAWLLELES